MLDATLFNSSLRTQVLFENSRNCSVGFDYDSLDGVEETPSNLRFSEADLMEFGRRIISYIRAHDRARLTVDCMYLAMGDAEVEHVTMTDVAHLHGVSKAAISKRVRDCREELHLPVNANNKSPRACAVYARTNRSPVSFEARASRAGSS